MEGSSIEKGPVYTREDFDREVAEKRAGVAADGIEKEMSAETDFLNNLWGKVPMKMNVRGSLLGSIEPSEMEKKFPRDSELFRAIDTFWNEHGIHRDVMTAREVNKFQQDVLIDLYIALRNQGFTHEEITR